MKKPVWLSVVIVLLFCMNIIHPVFAQTTERLEATQEVVGEELDYTLPYPGILSDHPLYIFKKVRDIVMRIFLSDPVKRIEFSLLQSDKYLAMAMKFADGTQWTKAEKAVVDSLTEMDRALSEVDAAKQAGVVIPEHVLTNLERSTVKHTQRIDDMKKTVQEKENGAFGKASDAFAQLAARASALRSE